MKNKCIILLWAAVFILISGAVSIIAAEDEQTPLEKNWGKSYQMIKKSQIAKPDACKNLAPVTGLNGNAAEMVMGNYLQSFKGSGQGQAPSSYTLTSGSTLGGSSVGLITTQK